MIGRRDFFVFVPALLLSTLCPLFLSSSSVSLSYFILAVPMRECLGKHSCMSSPFLIAILNGTLFFRSVKATNNWKLSAIKQILLQLSRKWEICVLVVYRFGKALWYCRSTWYVADAESVWSWRKIVESIAEFLCR